MNDHMMRNGSGRVWLELGSALLATTGRWY